MRGPIHSAPLPSGPVHRLSGFVPALYLDDPLFLALCAALDELLAPIVTALDCFPAYLDPALAPPDFLAWLGALVGIEPDPSWEQAGRARVAGAVRSYQARGTAAGLRAVVAAAAEVEVDRVRVVDSGGVVWSTAPEPVSTWPPATGVQVLVTLPAGSDAARVSTRVRAAVRPELPLHGEIRIDCQTQNEVVER